jgi:1,4-alpha-glucan branching enzyme
MVTDGSGRWWTTIADPGATRYGYYVAIDDQAHVWIGDPYATQVVWEGEHAWAYLPGAQGNFRWTDARWQTPALRDLVIYELCIRDFAGAWEYDVPHYGNFQRMLNHLDHLAATGVNAVELMPIQAFPGESSWGYNPIYYFAPATGYGRPDDFKALVDACHSRDIAVILDVAFHHAWGDQPYYQFYPPMYSPTGDELADLNPFFHHTPAAVNMWGGVDWDHFASPTTRYFQDIVRFWLREYHVDGFRFDWVCGVDFDSGNPMQPGFNPYHGIGAIAWAARQQKQDAILIGEYWQLEGAHPDKTAAKMIAETEIDAAWNGRFHHVLDDVLNQRWEWEKRDIFRAIGGYRDDGFGAASQVINYSTSHDEVRIEHEIKFYTGQTIARPKGMSIQQLALSKALLGLIVLMAAPGVPMLYAGQEFGEDTPRTIDFLPLNWDKLERSLFRSHFEIVRRLVAARRRYGALRSDHILFYDNDFAADKVVRFRRWDAQGGEAAAAFNFDGEPKRVSVPAPVDGVWREVVSDRVYDWRQGEVELTLEAWQGVIFVHEEGQRERSHVGMV